MQSIVILDLNIIMRRRDVLKYTALMTGAAIATPIALTISSCQSEVIKEGSLGALKFFSGSEINVVKSLIDTILPKTDSSSASEVGVHRTMDAMVGMVYNEEQRNTFRKSFDELNKYLSDQNDGKSFDKLGSDTKITVLKVLEEAESQELETKNAYLTLKQQTIAYYLSTEEVGLNYLNYLPVPGEYIECISLEEVGGKAWTL